MNTKNYVLKNIKTKIKYISLKQNSNQYLKQYLDCYNLVNLHYYLSTVTSRSFMHNVSEKKNALRYERYRIYLL